jgi:hypothetical protein
LDDEEIASEERDSPGPASTNARNAPTITVLQPPEFPPLVIAVPANEPAFVVESPPVAADNVLSVRADDEVQPAGRTDKPVAVVAGPPAEPPQKPAGPARIESVRSSDDRPSVMGMGGPILTVRLDRKRLATLNRLFSGPGDGEDVSIAAFVGTQEQLLSRALIATRLGKSPSPDSLSAPLPPSPPRIAAHTGLRRIDVSKPGEISLARAFAPSDMIALHKTVADEAAAPFQRAALLFVGLCANDLVVDGERERRSAGKALTDYAALATDEIGRIFVREKVSRAPAPFRPTDGVFDDAARTVLDTLGAALP